MTVEEHQYHFDTLQLHAGHTPDPTTKARAVPIYNTASYMFDSVEHVQDVFNMRTKGYFYTRVQNPTTEVFENRMAALEGGKVASAVASGMAAEFLTIATICKAGDNIVTSSSLYGGTQYQFKYTLAKFGIGATFIRSNDPEEFREAIDENTKLVYVESIGNPELTVPDFEALANVAHEAGIPFIVDNTFGAGGYVFKPLQHGADIVIHSATKWIGGHGTTLGGVVIDGCTFPWNNGKFPEFTSPVPSLSNMNPWEKYGSAAFTIRFKAEQMRDIGPCLNPFGSFLLLQGLETLSLRMERHCENTLLLAKWLQTREEVSWVSYLGLEDHPYHKMAKRYKFKGYGGVLTLGVKGCLATFINSVKLSSHLTNVGDAKTLVCAPALSTHGFMTEEEQKLAGVLRDQVRVSVGIEYIEDIKWDFDQALKKSYSKIEAGVAQATKTQTRKRKLDSLEERKTPNVVR